MAKLKVGVVGVGSMGKNHVRAYASLKHVCELIGVFDINQGMAEEDGQELWGQGLFYSGSLIGGG